MKRFLLVSVFMAVLFAAANAGIRSTHAQGVTVIVSQTPITSSTASSTAIKASSTYYVQICGLKKNAATVVDVTSSSMQKRENYTSNAQGCVNYSDTAPPAAGSCALTIQQFAGPNLQVVAVYQFNVV